MLWGKSCACKEPVPKLSAGTPLRQASWRVSQNHLFVSGAAVGRKDSRMIGDQKLNGFYRRLVDGRRENIVAAVKLSVGKLTGTRTADPIESGLNLGSSCSIR